MEQLSPIMEQPAHVARSGWPLTNGFRGTPLLVGLLLLGAALLKGQQLVTKSGPGSSFWTSRLVLSAAVAFELLLGMWVLSGIRAGWARLVALASFGLFLAVSLHRALSGETSCGCLGKLSVSPWLSATVDLAGLAGLTLWRPTDTGPLWLGRRVACGILIAGLAVAVVGAGAAKRTETARLAEDGTIEGEGAVVLEPDKWVGKRFPLLQHAGGAELLHGEWLVVLYRRNCRTCAAVLDQLGRGAEDKGPLAAVRLACIEIPSEGSPATDEELSWCKRLRLSAAREWLTRTPLCVRLSNGRTEAVTADVEEVRGWLGR